MRNPVTRFGIVAGAAFIALICVAVRPVSAHHGWGSYSENEFEISGTVMTPVTLVGPHATMQIKSADGKTWDLTLAPPARTEAAGLKEMTIPVGSTITAHGHRAKDQNRYEVKTERVTWNNRVFNVYPDRQ
jgi:hypothetical protein